MPATLVQQAGLRQCGNCFHSRHDLCVSRENGCICFQCHSRAARLYPRAFSHDELVAMMNQAARRVSLLLAAKTARAERRPRQCARAGCHRLLPPGSNRGRKTCSDACRMAMSRARLAERAKAETATVTTSATDPSPSLVSTATAYVARPDGSGGWIYPEPYTQDWAAEHGH